MDGTKMTNGEEETASPAAKTPGTDVLCASRQTGMPELPTGY